jgi:hypothetical protein
VAVAAFLYFALSIEASRLARKRSNRVSLKKHLPKEIGVCYSPSEHWRPLASDVCTV